jgi:hypothetical protein
MEFDTIVKELRVQQRRINAALVALVGTADIAIPASQLTATAPAHHAIRREHTLSAGVKRKISRSMKRNWASRKPKFVLSPAIKNKISVSQKARWASIKAIAAGVGPAPGGNHEAIANAA